MADGSGSGGAGRCWCVALVSGVFCVESVQKAAEAFGMSPAFVGFIVVAHRWVPRRDALGDLRRAQESAGPERGYRGDVVADRPVRRTRAGAG